MKTRLQASFQCKLAVIAVSAATLLNGQQSNGRDQARPIGPVLEEIEKFIRLGMETAGVPGVGVAIVHRDKVVYMKGFGVRKVGERPQVDPDTVFQLASVSKSIASTVVASLVGTRDVRWDDRIIDLDRSFRLYDQNVTYQLTLRDVLSHRSGLPTSAGDVLDDLGFTRPEILHKMRLLRPTGIFRETYQYSNFPFTEGAIAASKGVKQQWENIADERLFKPLGMSSTSYRYSDYKDRVNKAAIHVFVDGKPAARYKRDPDAQAPAGGASSSVRDLAEWLRLQLSGGKWNGQAIIAADALKETHTPQIQIGTDPAGSPVHYGLGWNVAYDENREPILSHSGAFYLGAGTAIRFSPSDQLGIAVVTNALPTGLAEAITYTLFDLYRFGKPSQDWLTLGRNVYGGLIESLDNATTNYSALTPPASPVPGRPLSIYVGMYHNDYYGQIEISEQQGVLWMRLPGRGGLYSLTHWDRDTFTYRYEGDQHLPRGVAFTFDGRPQVLLENLALEGNGVFIRSEQ